MKFFSILSLLITASNTIVYAHPGFSPNFEIIETRGYIDIPSSLLPLEKRDDFPEIIQLEIRGDGNGGELKKAGDIMGKVGKGLSVVSAATGSIPIVGTAVSVVKTAVEVFSLVIKAIGAAQHRDALKRGAFTQDVVTKTLQKHPGWNCVVVHTKHKKDFKGAEGKDWAHAHQELKVSFPVGSTIGFEIYTFREGYFELQGDGGYLNWAYGGQVIKGDAKSKKLTFGSSSQAKGTATDANKDTPKEAAKSAGKKSKSKKKRNEEPLLLDA